MQNDMLKNTIAPWQEKGRWYHGIIDSATHTFLAEKTDKFLFDNFALTNVGNSYHIWGKTASVLNNIVDVKVKYHNIGLSNYATINITKLYEATGRISAFVYPAVITSGEIEIWVFID